MSTQVPEIKEKIGAALTYLTLGIWGLIWLLISRTPAYFQKDFVKFHCYQSIFIGILYMFIPSGLSILFSLIFQIAGFIPNSIIVVSNLGIVYGFIQKAVSFIGLMLILACAIVSLMGKYTNIPYISQMINRMLR